MQRLDIISHLCMSILEEKSVRKSIYCASTLSTYIAITCENDQKIPIWIIDYLPLLWEGKQNKALVILQQTTHSSF